MAYFVLFNFTISSNKKTLFSSKNEWLNTRQRKYHMGYPKYECVALQFLPIL